MTDTPRLAGFAASDVGQCSGASRALVPVDGGWTVIQ
jgi:hypothetical protein